MYLTPLKAMIVQALRQTLDGTYPVVEMRGMHVSIEYPIDPANYPGIWVDYDDTVPLMKAGINHEEYVETDEGQVLVTRWRFAGYLTLTVAALTSLERDNIYDELVSMIAFARQDTLRGRFVSMVETNDFVACNIDTDTIQPRGAVAAPGTPWGTDEIVYERTINLNVVGEFVPSPDPEQALVLLSEIIVRAVSTLDEEGMEDLENSEQGFTRDKWH